LKDVTRPSTTEGSCIDNIFTNDISTINNRKIIQTNFSDHNAIEAEIVLNTKIHRLNYKIEIRKINKETLSALKMLLANENWYLVYLSQDPDEANVNFIEKFTHYYNIACPKYIKKSRRPKTYFEPTDEIKQLKALMTVLKFNKNNSSEGELLGRKIKNCSAKLRKAHEVMVKQHLSDRIKNSKNVPKETWKIINQNKNNIEKKENSLVLNVQGKPCSNTKLIANAFNEHYIKVPEKIKENIGSVPIDCNSLNPIESSLVLLPCDN